MLLTNRTRRITISITILLISNSGTTIPNNRNKKTATNSAAVLNKFKRIITLLLSQPFRSLQQGRQH